MTIDSAEQLKHYLAQDRKQRFNAEVSPLRRLLDPIWQYQYALRQLEFAINTRRARLIKLFWHWRYRRLGLLLGFSIPPNVFGPGLSIAHFGTIVVNGKARVGANCRIHVCTNIGNHPADPSRAPVIGNNCYIGPGAKIYGDITLGDNVRIGANAVVNRSFPDDDITLVGIPARPT